MQTTRYLLPLSLLWITACAASSGGTSATPAATDPDAATATAAELTVARPEGWKFVAVDDSVPNDVAVLLVGPSAGSAPAAMVQVAVRPRTSTSKRWGAEQVLTSTMTEYVQLFAGFETTSGPDPVEIAGKPASIITMTLSEMAADGTEMQRSGRFYCVVTDANVYIIRCLGPSDGSANTAIDSIIGSMKL